MDVATATARPSQEEGRPTETNPEEVAQTVRLLAEEAAIRESLVRESKGDAIKASPSVAGSVSGPVKRPRGRPRKHPLPETPSPKRPRGRPKKNPIPESPVPIVPVKSSVAMALTAGGVQSTSLAATQAPQVTTAVHLFQPKAGSPGIQVVGDPAKVYVACVGTPTPIAVPVSLLTPETDSPGLAQLLTAEPAFPLPQPNPLAVEVHSNGGDDEEGVKVVNASRPTSTPTKRREESGVSPSLPVTVAISTTQPAGVAISSSSIVSPLGSPKRPRGRPRKHPRPNTAPGVDPISPHQPPAAEPEKRPRGRPKKTPLVQAQVSVGEKAIEATEQEVASGPELEGDDQLGPSPTKRPRGRPKKGSLTTPTPTANDESVQSPTKRPRGRPRKRPLPVQPATQASSTDVPVPTNGASQQPAKRPKGRPRKHPLPVSSQSEEESLPSSGEAGALSPTKRPRGRPKKHVAAESPAVQGTPGSADSSPVKKRRGRPPKHPKLPPDPTPPGQGQSLPPTGGPSPSVGGIEKPAGQTGSTGVVKRARGRPRKTPLPAAEDPGADKPQPLPLDVPSKPEQPSSSEGRPATQKHTASTTDQGGEKETADPPEGHSDGGLQLAFSDDSSESEGEERAKLLTALAKRVCVEERPGGVAKPDDEEGEEVDVMKCSPPLEPQFEESFDDDSSCSEHSVH